MSGAKVYIKPFRLFRSAEFYLFLILVFGLFIRIYHISPALLELVPNRQIIDAALARGLYQRGLVNLGMHLFGLPLYHWLVVGLYTLMGGVNEVVGRLVSVVFSIFSAYFFYKLVSLFGPKRQALMALFFFYILSPVHIIISRSFLIDEMTLFLGLVALYCVALWQRSRKTIQFILGLFFFTLMLLSKFTFGYLMLPALWLLHIRSNTIRSRWGPAIVFLFLALPLMASWYLYVKNVNELLNQGPTGEWNPAFFFAIENVFSATYYINIFFFLFNYATTFFALPFVFLGLVLKKHVDGSAIFYLWIIGAMGFILTFSRSTISHNYYYLAFAPPLAFFAARSVEWLYQRITKAFAVSRPLLMLGLAVLSLPSVVSQDFLRAYRTEPEYATITLVAGITRNLTPPTATVLTSAFRMSGVFYFADRKGYELRLGPLNSAEAIAELETFRNLGAQYYVVYDSIELANKADFAKYLERYRVIFESPDLDVVIYRL